MRRGRHRSIGLAAAPTILLFVAASLFATASASPRAAQPRPRVIPLVAPSGLRGSLSEPHLARDPANPSVLVAVAQTPHALVAWRSQDSGRRWRASQPVAGASGPRGGYGAGDPVIALGPDGVALLAAVAFDTKGPCTLLNRVGSYRSQNGGRTFGRLAGVGETAALPRHFFGVPPLPKCPIPKGLSHVTTQDKPWIAIDDTDGPRRGSAYVVWSRNEQFANGATFTTLLFAASRDGGRSYGKPVAVAPRARRPGELEHYSQVAVRPNGTVDLVWNDLRKGLTVILHAASRNGGAQFGRPEVVSALPRGTTPTGLVTTLAVAPSGRLGLCWSASTRPKAYTPRIWCTLSSGNGRWAMPVAPFGNAGAQYLPAVAFQDERLWVAGYRSTAGNTRVLVSSTDDGRTFAATTTLAGRPYGRSSLCGPHPPDCQPRQSFVGDYIGAVAAPGRVWVDFVLPAGPASSANRLFVATLETAP